VGTYPITANGAADANYTLNFVVGNLLVTEITGTAELVLTIARVGSGSTELALQGTVGNTYLIEASTNLVDWVTVTNVLMTDSIMRFFDPAASTSNRRYYRANLL